MQRGSIGGGEVIVVDVTDPADPHIRSRAPATTSTHTLQCVTAGTRTRPATARSSRSSTCAISTTRPGGHRAVEGLERQRDLLHRRRPLLGLRLRGRRPAHRLGRRRVVRRLRPAAPGRRREAQRGPPERPARHYFNDGDELLRDRAGTVQTWHVPTLGGGGTIGPLDIIDPVKLGDGLSTPIGGFCSAHWFDCHQSGIVAQGHYQQGLRFIDVRDASDLEQYAYVTGGGTEVWGPGARPPRRRTKTDVYQVAVPGTDLGETDDSLRDLLPERS